MKGLLGGVYISVLLPDRLLFAVHEGEHSALLFHMTYLVDLFKNWMSIYTANAQRMI